MTGPETALDSERRFGVLLQGIVLESPDVSNFLTGLADLAVARLSRPGAPVESSTTLLRPRRPVTVASSGDRAARMDELQYRAGDGPCLTAARTQQTVSVDDLRQESRWTAYRDATADSGIHSVLAVPIPLDGGGAASLNLYSGAREAFDGPARAAAEAFAGQASRALGLAVRIGALTDTAHDLRAAMASRTTIDLAAGIVMAQNRCSHDAAIAILMKASSLRNTKLRDVAAAVVASAGGQPG
ncbi:GAF and ANTAR domain-containing protein [Arthrobacter sp. TMN-37]